MTNTEYRKERIKRGYRYVVAAKLGISSVTLWHRETGVTPIKREHELALLAIPEKSTSYRIAKI